MNDFKNSLKVKADFNLIDKQIQSIVFNELNLLESNAGCDAYKQHIENRKNDILNLLNNFNFNMHILESALRFTASPKFSTEKTYKTVLDRRIGITISDKLKTIYEDYLNWGFATKQELTQLYDRDMSIEKLLENFDYYIGIIKSQNKEFELEESNR